MIKKLLTASTILASALALTSCGSDSKPIKDPTPIPGATGGSLTIGIDMDQPGLGFKDGDTYTGFDVDVATYVAKALGVDTANITWVEATPDNRETLLTSGEVDMVFSTYSITPERAELVDFAGPYFIAHQDLLIRRNDTEITGPKTLDGKVLCSVTGTTSSAYVEENFKGDIDLRQFDRFSECVQALDNGLVDAVTTDDVILAGFASEDRYQGKLKLVGDGFTDEKYGVGLPKGDTELLAQVNEALQQFIDDGSWATSLNNNVAPSGYQIPSPPEIE